MDTSTFREALRHKLGQFKYRYQADSNGLWCCRNLMDAHVWQVPFRRGLLRLTLMQFSIPEHYIKLHRERCPLELSLLPWTLSIDFYSKEQLKECKKSKGPAKPIHAVASLWPLSFRLSRRGRQWKVAIRAKGEPVSEVWLAMWVGFSTMCWNTGLLSICLVSLLYKFLGSCSCSWFLVHGSWFLVLGSCVLWALWEHPLRLIPKLGPCDFWFTAYFWLAGARHGSGLTPVISRRHVVLAGSRWRYLHQRKVDWISRSSLRPLIVNLWQGCHSRISGIPW